MWLLISVFIMLGASGWDGYIHLRPTQATDDNTRAAHGQKPNPQDMRSSNW